MPAIVLIAIIGTPDSPAQALSRFHTAWLVGVIAALGSAAVSLLHLRPEPVAPAVELEMADAA